MKYLLQILAALLYTSLFTSLIAAITIFPMVWLFSLSTFWMVIILFFFFGIFQGLISMAQTFVTLPYAWIVKGNGVALGISIIAFVSGMIMTAVKLWQTGPEGFWQVAGMIVLTILLIEVAFGTIANLLGLYSQEY